MPILSTNPFNLLTRLIKGSTTLPVEPNADNEPSNTAQMTSGLATVSQSPLALKAVATDIQDNNKQSLYTFFTSSTNTLRSTANVLFEKFAHVFWQASPSLTTQVPGGNKQERLAKLQQEFSTTGLYLRTISDHDDEFNNTFMPKHIGQDTRYWSSATFIQKDLRAEVHDPLNDRTGLILSGESLLGGFCNFDAATTNVPSGQDPKDYFPANFPKFDLMHAFDYADEYDISDANTVSDDKLAKIPEEYRSVFVFDQIQEKMKTKKESGAKVEPTEAKICYQPKDVLGIYVDMASSESKRKAGELHKNMKSQGFDIPFIHYQQDGTFVVHDRIL